MRKTYFLSCMSLLLAMLAGCSEESIGVYQGDNYIYFTKASTDSTTFSFAYDASLTEGDVSLKLNLISRLEDRTRHFAVRLVEEESTAREGRDFSIDPQTCVVHPNDSIAYLSVHVMKDASLAGRSVKAVFEVVASEDFLPRIGRNQRANLVITDKLARPEWWNSWHESSGLGAYSDKKYRLFIDVTGQHDLTLTDDGGTMDYSDMRGYVVMFKYWLHDHPQEEEDGSEMTVPIIG